MASKKITENGSENGIDLLELPATTAKPKSSKKLKLPKEPITKAVHYEMVIMKKK